MSEWRPIESAPMNEAILLYAANTDWPENNMYVGHLWSTHDGRIIASLNGSDCQTGCGDTGSPPFGNLFAHLQVTKMFDDDKLPAVTYADPAAARGYYLDGAMISELAELQQGFQFIGSPETKADKSKRRMRGARKFNPWTGDPKKRF